MKHRQERPNRDAARPCTRRRVRYEITGTVQGIGFRPALYRLACAFDLGGSVQNRSGSVRLTLEGPLSRVRAFLQALPESLPPHARIDGCALLDSDPLPESYAVAPFCIDQSEPDDCSSLQIPVDLAVCPDCRREVLDPADRRYGYAFTTCTACGPRYTVVSGMPYDRASTTLSVFALCARCRREYEHPGNRRFHAESIACPQCGPRLWMETASGRRDEDHPLRRARAALSSGAVLAVRGMGGFLLAADARNRDALRSLRNRKNRPHKPFAVMARNLEVARSACRCTAAAEQLLTSPAAPVVILHVRSATTSVPGLPMDLIAPDTQTLGVMLPTTPLHLLLAEPLQGDPVPPFDWLIMTSGNRGGEPICIRNEEARERLRGIADGFLMHNREIHRRNDDSLFAVHAGRPQVWRRARGCAPEPIRLRNRVNRCVLAMGAELRNTVALAFADRVVLSPHIGDLESPQAGDALRQAAEDLPRFLDRRPQIVAVDAHPDMYATRLGRAYAARLDIPVVEVLHHHAHALAALSEHGQREGLALVFDGTGLGMDGNVWGSELFHVDGDDCFRLASFCGVPLPGGDAAVRQPARQLIGRCVAAGIELPDIWLARLGITGDERRVWTRQCQQGLNAPIAHSAGRLFDSFAVALGLAPALSTYDGQAAVRLETAARRTRSGDSRLTLPYRVEERNGMLWTDWSEAFCRLTESRTLQSPATATWARAAHRAVAEAATHMAEYGAGRTGLDSVALSGGVFMNEVLTGMLERRLRKRKFTVYLHRNVPPNDGCIAFGQALAARARSP